MEVREGSNVDPGTYVARFIGFIARERDGAIIRTTEQGPKVLYRLRTRNGLTVPGSFLWDPDHYSAERTLGAFGVPVRALKKVWGKLSPQVLVRRVEEKAKERGVDLNVWVGDGGWVNSIRPNEGVFVVRFGRVTSREDGKPVHVHRTGSRKSRRGGSYTFDEDTFTVSLEVVAGPHEGVTYPYRLEYAIKKDQESGNWYFDAQRAWGRRAYEFLALLGVRVEKLNPDSGKYKDPANILPELERVFYAVRPNLVIEVEDGWVVNLTRQPDTEKAEDVLELGPAVGSRFLSFYGEPCTPQPGRRFGLTRIGTS